MGYGTRFRHGNAALRWLQKFMRNAPHSNTGWKRNTTDSWASKYNNFREKKMNPGKCCTLRIENTGESGACSMPTGPQLQNKDTNQSVQKKEKRKQHILALQREWIPVFFR